MTPPESKRLNMRAELTALLGRANAHKLMQHFGGQKVRIPVPDRSERDRQILATLGLPGMTYAAVAERFKLSRRQVFRIANRS